MKGIRLAEWLLCHVTTPAHAATQVGDLLEISQTRGRLWFWCAVLGSLMHGSFRFMLAFVSALGFSQIMAILWAHGSLGNEPDMHSVYTAGLLLLAPLCIVPVFLLLRFGWRDANARFCLLFALVAGISLVSHPHQILRWTLLAAALFTVSISLAKSRRNWIPLQSLAQLSSAVAISVGGLALYFLTLIFYWAVISYWLNRPTAFFNATVILSKHPVNDLLNALVCLLIVRSSERWREVRVIRQPT